MNRINSPFSNPYKLNHKKLKLKKNALDKVDFEEEKKNDPKYKTELCKSFMENHFCQYGNKCRYAHGKDDLVIKEKINNYKRKLCKSFFKEGFCTYGIRWKSKGIIRKRLKVFEEITNNENFLSESTISSSIDDSPNHKKDISYYDRYNKFSEFCPYYDNLNLISKIN